MKTYDDNKTDKYGNVSDNSKFEDQLVNMQTANAVLRASIPNISATYKNGIGPKR